MSYWKNLPSMETPLNAENLNEEFSKTKKYHQATGVINGDFKIDIDGAGGLARGDVIRVEFGLPKQNTQPARLSIDDGLTFKNIKLTTYKTQLIASDLTNKRQKLVYNGTEWETIPEQEFLYDRFGEYGPNLGNTDGFQLGDTLYMNKNVETATKLILIISHTSTSNPLNYLENTMSLHTNHNTLRGVVIFDGGSLLGIQSYQLTIDRSLGELLFTNSHYKYSETGATTWKHVDQKKGFPTINAIKVAWD